MSHERDRILSQRRNLIGPSLSLSYAEPLLIVRGEGAYLFDEEGNAYLDCVNNVCHVGHSHPSVVEAATRQMAQLNTNTRYLHPNLVSYAERLLTHFPAPLEVCYLVNSGSEANDLALRLARTTTGRHPMIVIDHAYHGHTQALIDISPYKFNGRGGKGAPTGTHVLPIPDTYRGAFGADNPEAGPKYAAAIDEFIALEAARGNGIAGFIAESIVGCGGQVPLPTGYLQRCFSAVRDAGGVCIVDEVQVGVGRVGSHFWGFELYDVVPDIVTMGKPLGNGHPLAAVVTTRAIADAFNNGMEYFNTFGGNPVSCAVGMAVLDVMEVQGLQAHALEVGRYFQELLNRLKAHYPLIGDVRGHGLFLGVELVRDPWTKEPAGSEAARIIEEMKNRRILLSTDGPHHNVIKIKPPMVFTRQNAEQVVEQLDSILKTVD